MSERKRVQDLSSVSRFVAQISIEPHRQFNLDFILSVVKGASYIAHNHKDTDVRRGGFEARHKALAIAFEMFESGENGIQVELITIDTESEKRASRLHFIFRLPGQTRWATRTKIENMLGVGITAKRLQEAVGVSE